LKALEKLARTFDWGQPQVGDMPPAPPTLRAKLGAILVRVIRRALFWYSGQIQSFHRLVAEAADEQLRTLQQLTADQQRTQAAITEIEARLQVLSEDERVDQLRTDVEARTEALRAEFRRDDAALRRDLSSKHAALNSEIQAELVRIARLLHESVPYLRIHELRCEVAPPPGAGREEAEARLDAGYRDAFRGDSGQIRERLRVYLPHVRRAYAAAGEAPALDLGCGRGEWLDLMRDEQIAAAGVDTARHMVEHCTARGLTAAHADLLEYLRNLPGGSLSAVTLFHVVEHLPAGCIPELLDEVVRVMKEGGVALFETPNPRNLLVATYNFHLDPTHNRPLPSELLAFLAESRGLRSVEVLPLHPFPDSFRLEENSCPAARLVNDAFFGPQDYGLIGWKL
jgi:O-antigen chain-terminating methyltransferase